MTVANVHINKKKRARCAAVVLCNSAEDRRAITAALEGWDVDFRERSREVLGALRTTGAPLFVTRPATMDTTSHADLIRGIREGAPAFDIVALARGSEQHRGALVTITQLGVGEVLFLDEPDFAEQLGAVVQRTRLSYRVAECGRRVAAGLPPKVAYLVRWSFQRGLRYGSVTDFAAAKGVSNRTLRHRLAAYNLSPEDLLRWRRVIAAFVIFEHTLLTVDRAARRVGFPSASALQNAVHRSVGISRPQVLRAGGTHYLIRMLREKMGLEVQE